MAAANTQAEAGMHIRALRIGHFDLLRRSVILRRWELRQRNAVQASGTRLQNRNVGAVWKGFL